MIFRDEALGADSFIGKCARFLGFPAGLGAGSQSVSTAPVLVLIQVSGPTATLIAGQSQFRKLELFRH